MGSFDALLVADEAKYRELTARRWFGRSEELPVQWLTPADARARYRFDLGHPLDGAVYVANPCVPGHYLVPASANERMAQEKLAAFAQIAAALGARRVELLAAEVSAGEKGGGAGVSAMGARLGISVKVDREGGVSRSLYTELLEPTAEPHVPEACRPWLDMDPVLRALVQARLHARPHIYNVELQVNDVLEIASKLELMLGGKGVDLGGKVRTVGSSTWKFQIEFWPTGKVVATAPCPWCRRDVAADQLHARYKVCPACAVTAAEEERAVFRPAPGATGVNAEVELALAELRNPDPSFAIRLALATGTGRVTRDIAVRPRLGRYKVGDAVTLTVTPEVDCYLYLLNLGTSGKTTVLFPNGFHEDNFLRGGEPHALPGPDYPFDWVLEGPPGTERIKAIATKRRISLWELDFEGGAVVFRAFDAARVTRDIAVVRRQLGGVGPGEWSVTDTSFEVTP